MIRDFVSDDDSIDLSALDIADVANVTTVQDAGRICGKRHARIG